MENKDFNEKEFLKAVEKAASKGASKGATSGLIWSKLLSVVLTVALIAGAMLYITNMLGNALHVDIFAKEEAVEGHDMTLDNHGIFGYTAVDFSEAVLGDADSLKKIEVYRQEVSDVATVTNAGLGKFQVFSKTKLITYHGTAIYTVDLSQLKSSDFSVDEDKHIVTIAIPRTKRGEIIIPSENIEFGDTEKGLLAIGDIKLTSEELADVQTEAKNKMIEKLKADNVRATADEFAKKAVWELYRPLIEGVSPGYTLEIVIQPEEEE